MSGGYDKKVKGMRLHVASGMRLGDATGRAILPDEKNPHALRVCGGMRLPELEISTRRSSDNDIIALHLSGTHAGQRERGSTYG